MGIVFSIEFWDWALIDSGNSDLLPGMYRFVDDHRIGFIGDFTE